MSALNNGECGCKRQEEELNNIYLIQLLCEHNVRDIFCKCFRFSFFCDSFVAAFLARAGFSCWSLSLRTLGARSSQREESRSGDKRSTKWRGEKKERRGKKTSCCWPQLLIDLTTPIDLD